MDRVTIETVKTISNVPVYRFQKELIDKITQEISYYHVLNNILTDILLSKEGEVINEDDVTYASNCALELISNLETKIYDLAISLFIQKYHSKSLSSCLSMGLNINYEIMEISRSNQSLQDENVLLKNKVGKTLEKNLCFYLIKNGVDQERIIEVNKSKEPTSRELMLIKKFVSDLTIVECSALFCHIKMINEGVAKDFLNTVNFKEE